MKKMYLRAVSLTLALIFAFSCLPANVTAETAFTYGDRIILEAENMSTDGHAIAEKTDNSVKATYLNGNDDWIAHGGYLNLRIMGNQAVYVRARSLVRGNGSRQLSVRYTYSFDGEKFKERFFTIAASAFERVNEYQDIRLSAPELIGAKVTEIAIFGNAAEREPIEVDCFILKTEVSEEGVLFEAENMQSELHPIAEKTPTSIIASYESGTGDDWLAHGGYINYILRADQKLYLKARMLEDSLSHRVLTAKLVYSLNGTKAERYFDFSASDFPRVGEWYNFELSDSGLLGATVLELVLFGNYADKVKVECDCFFTVNEDKEGTAFLEAEHLNATVNSSKTSDGLIIDYHGNPQDQYAAWGGYMNGRKINIFDKEYWVKLMLLEEYPPADSRLITLSIVFTDGTVKNFEYFTSDIMLVGEYVYLPVDLAAQNGKGIHEIVFFCNTADRVKLKIDKIIATDVVRAKDVNVDGEYNLLDFVRMKKYFAGSIPEDEYALKNSDINNDGEVDSKDLSEIIKFLILSGDSSMKNYCCNFTVGDELDYLITDNMSAGEIVLANSIQGIVAKTKSQIFLQNNNSDHTYIFDMLVDDYGIKMNKIDSVWELLEKYKPYIKDSGYVTYVDYNPENTLEEQQSINSACTVGGIEGWIVVEKSLEAKVKRMGFFKKEAGGSELSVFNRYSAEEKLNKHFLIEAAYNIACLRDFGMAVGAMFYYENDMQKMRTVAEYLEPNGMVMGWLHHEPPEVSMYSSMGLMVEPSDWVENLTVLAALGNAEDYKPKNVNRYESQNNDVHYISFMMSDGDNYSYLQGSPTVEGKYGDPLRGTIPFGWTYACSAAAMAPFFNRYYFEKSSTNNDSFISALGAGYIHVTAYPKEQYPTFASLTAEWMEKSGLEYVLLADETINSVTDSLLNDKYRYTIEEMAKYPNIKGGMLSYGQGYVPKLQGEDGSVTWVNDKPFITNKDVLWSTSPTGVTNEEISEWARKINGYEKDATKIEGYSLLTVHTWSWKYSDVVRLASMLDDNVIIVTPTELMELINKNVAHTDVRFPEK